MQPDFWNFLDQLIASCAIEIERPAGSLHPRHPEILYPLNYGFLRGTSASDGAEIDLFRGSAPEPILSALLLTIDLDKRDSEIKLLLGCTPQEEQIALHFLNQGNMRATLLPRKADASLQTRRSIRRFAPQPVPPPLLKEILQTTLQAPSAHGLQPWRFVHVQSAQARQALGQALTLQMQADMQAQNAPSREVQSRIRRSLRRIAEAPEIILLFRDQEILRTPEAEEEIMSIQSVAMAGLQLMLSAHLHGLGANWLCWSLYAPQAVSQALRLPLTWQSQGMVFLG